MKTHTLVFTRQEKGSITSTAILVLTTPVLELNSKPFREMYPGEAKEAFSKALNEWAATDAGKAAWKESSQGFNIGDYALVENDPEIKAILLQHGIEKADLTIAEADSSHDYDEVIMTFVMTDVFTSEIL